MTDNKKKVINKEIETKILDDGTQQTIYIYTVEQPSGNHYKYKKYYIKKGYITNGNNNSGNKNKRVGRKRLSEGLKEKRKELTNNIKKMDEKQLEKLNKLIEVI